MSVHNYNYGIVCYTFVACLSLLLIGALAVLSVAVLWSIGISELYYQLNLCNSESLPHLGIFVGREEDIKNITGYLDFTNSNVQVVHIVGPPGFGKSTLAVKIGHGLLRKCVRVHYVDVKDISNVNTLVERVLVNVIGSPKKQLTLHRLEKWIHKQYSNTLFLFDNCDDILETSREAFLEMMKKLQVSSLTRSVRFVLTSQKWVADVGNFRLHAIYNLSCEAAHQLLGEVAPSLTDDEKIQIAKLTGNVPLALDVVGAIFNFPNAPTAEEVIQGLKEEPVATLSRPELHSKVDVSIGLAYMYLTPELQMLCLNLSYFPGSFDQDIAAFIFDLEIISYSYFIHSQLDMLVQRSLLQFSHPTKTYKFHQLIQKYFQSIVGKSFGDSLQENFEGKFQLYYATDLSHTLNISKYDMNSALARLEANKRNFQHMVYLFAVAKHVNYTYHGVQVTLLAIKSEFLQLRFSVTETLIIVRNMLESIESYTIDEEASHESFLETYVELVIQAAKQEKLATLKPDVPVELLSSRKSRIDDGYTKSRVSVNTYIKFYNNLAQYYDEKGEKFMSTLYHTHLLNKVYKKLNGCYPNCDYFSISVAYDSVGLCENAFNFRKLSFEHQQPSLNCMSQAKLFLSLHNDFSNSSLGNNISRAKYFSNKITEGIYLCLLNANEFEYSEEVYFDAIDFFRTMDMKDFMFQLQNKMKNVILMRCLHALLVPACLKGSLIRAWKRDSYYHVILLGKTYFESVGHREFQLWNEHFMILEIVGKAYYEIGNYSDAQIWLKRSLMLVNQELEDNWTFETKWKQATICSYLISSGDYFHATCYGALLTRDIVYHSTLLFKFIFQPILKESTGNNSHQPTEHPEGVIPSKDTNIRVEKPCFVIFQQVDRLLHKVQFTIGQFLSIANNAYTTMGEYTATRLFLVLLRVGISILTLFCLSFIICFGAFFFIDLIILMYTLCVFRIFKYKSFWPIYYILFYVMFLHIYVRRCMRCSIAITVVLFTLMVISYLCGSIDITNIERSL